MSSLKAVVQEAMRSLSMPQLRLLADSLRMDLEGCKDRNDMERRLTGLVSLDHDTSLGVFLTSLRSFQVQDEQNDALVRKHSAFGNTFLPALASLGASRFPSSEHSKADSNEDVQEHHVRDELCHHLVELEALEVAVKHAERRLHTGSPTLDKLKEFLLKVTKLRAKEHLTRTFLLRRTTALDEHLSQVQTELLQSRAQVDFFVHGLTKLQQQHEALRLAAARMKAESETTQELFLAMSAHDCHFEHVVRHTLQQQMHVNDKLKYQLEQTHEKLHAAVQTQKDLEARISQLKHERGEARKDAHCCKRQLRVCKRRRERREGDGNGSFFRHQAMELRHTMAMLLDLVHDVVVRDSKAPKQTLCKKVLQIVHQVVTPSPKTLKLESSSLCEIPRESVSNKVDQAQTRIGYTRATFLDIDEVIRGVLLVEDAASTDAAECAQLMSEKLKYLPIDLKQTLAQLQTTQTQAAQAFASDVATESSSLPALQVFADALAKHVSDLMMSEDKRGFVMYNWPFSRHDVNLIMTSGLPVDSVINLKSVGGIQALSPEAASASAKLFTGKDLLATSSAAPSKAIPSKSTSVKLPLNRTVPPTAAAKSRPHHPTRGVVAIASNPKAPVAQGPATFEQTPHSTEATNEKVVTLASSLQGLGDLLQSVEPTPFPAERVTSILQVLELQKRRKVAPVVQWDEATQRTNEMLAMWVEEVQMHIQIEQESRIHSRELTAVSSIKAVTTSSQMTGKPTSKTSTATSKAK